MENDFTEAFCSAITDADSDRVAVAVVAGLLSDALDTIIEQTIVSESETEQGKSQLLALAGYLKRATHLLHLGTLMLKIGGRDPAWALLSGAARPIERLLATAVDADPDEHSVLTYLPLDALAAESDQGSGPDHEPVDSAHHRVAATISMITETRLGRPPEVFVDEDHLDAHYVSITWDLISAGAAHIQDHVCGWQDMEDINVVAHAVEQARALRDDTFPSAA